MNIKTFISKNVYEPVYTFRHRKKKLANYQKYKSAVCNMYGLEIGGPSKVFKKKCPIYHHAYKLDGINFSTSTLWEKNLKDTGNFQYFLHKRGVQYISDATNLSRINNSTYDFLSSSHCLEHIANPLKALKEWKRVIKDNAYLILVLPNKYNNFDSNRKFTKFDHILKDFENDIDESDLTHLDEIIELHDFELDKESGSLEDFILRGRNNIDIRGLHHHVFDESLIKKMLYWCNFSIIDFSFDEANFFTLAKKK